MVFKLGSHVRVRELAYNSLLFEVTARAKMKHPVKKLNYNAYLLKVIENPENIPGSLNGFVNEDKLYQVKKISIS